MVITFVLFFVMSIVTGIVIYARISDVVQDFTVSTPLPKLPIVEMTDEQLLVVKDRMVLFVDQLRAGVNPNDLDDLVITQDEINGMIGRSDYLRGNAHVTVEEGALYEEYSLPTDILPGGAGRYFVGNDYMKMQGEDRIEFKMETAAAHHEWFDGPLLFAQLQYMVNEKDIFELYLEKGSFFGHQATQEFIDQRNNLLQDLYDDNEDTKDARAVLDGIEYVSFHPGMIVIHPGK